jgi:O-antigen ligase
LKPAQTSTLERAAWLLLCLLVFSLPLEKAVEVPGIGTISRALGLCAFAAGAAVAARRRSLRPPNAALLLAAAFVAWSGLTYFGSVHPPATAARFTTLVQLFGMLWLVWELCRTAALELLLMRAYVAGAAVSSVLTIARAAQNQQTYWRRFATPGFDPNDLGVTLALAIPLALYLAYRAGEWEAWAYRLAAALSIAAILLTASRTALIAACLAFTFAVLTWMRGALAHRLSSLALAGLLVCGALWGAPSASRERLATLPSELTTGTLHNRTRIWKTGLKAYKGNWFAGVGAGAFPEAVEPWLGKPPIPDHFYTAHNTFLSVLVETGVVGFALFGSLLAALALFAWMTAPATRALWFTCLLVWAAGASTLTWENRKPTWLLFALIMAAWARGFRPKEREP